MSTIPMRRPSLTTGRCRKCPASIDSAASRTVVAAVMTVGRVVIRSRIRTSLTSFPSATARTMSASVMRPRGRLASSSSTITRAVAWARFIRYAAAATWSSGFTVDSAGCMTSPAVRAAAGGCCAEAPVMIHSASGDLDGIPLGSGRISHENRPASSRIPPRLAGVFARLPGRRIGRSEDIANAIGFLIDDGFVTGAALQPRAPPDARVTRGLAASGQPRHYRGGQALHLPGLVEERVEQDHPGARVRHLAQPARAGVGRPPYRYRGQVRGAEEPVDPVERRGHSLPRALGVVVHGDVDALGDREPRRIAALGGELLAHGLHLP